MIIIPKRPYTDWLNSFENVLEYNDNQATTILIHDKYDEIDYETYLKNFLRSYLRMSHGLPISMFGQKRENIKFSKNGSMFFVWI